MVFVARASMFVYCSAIGDARRPSAAARFSVLPHMVALEPNPGRDQASGPGMRTQRVVVTTSGVKNLVLAAAATATEADLSDLGDL
jgi:hypothetical protein